MSNVIRVGMVKEAIDPVTGELRIVGIVRVDLTRDQYNLLANLTPEQHDRIASGESFYDVVGIGECNA